jgi:lipopolysaccharide/colanic/teichoic acid biosynthesis glycosyltransferase
MDREGALNRERSHCNANGSGQGSAMDIVALPEQRPRETEPARDPAGQDGTLRRVPIFDDPDVERQFFATQARRGSDDAPRVAAGSHPHVRSRTGPLILAPDVFAQEVEHEKRRSDRSKAPVSLAVFRMDARSARGAFDFMTLLAREKREIDVVGALRPGELAVLLPVTDHAGAERFIERVRGAAREGPQVSGDARTYPDSLFAEVLEGHPDTSGDNLLTSGPPDDGQRLARRIKRVVDVVGASVALLVASPVMLVAAIAVALSSRGPIIYSQQRLGQHGRRFTFYKFRTMFVNADDRIHREYVTALIAGAKQGAAATDGPAWRKLERDPRITRVGRVLRRTSVDELPQLFNVLKGDLSLVGPRPPIPYEAERYEPWHMRRVTDAKPGISGPWQVDSRGRSSFDDMVRMDIEYARDWSLRRDLRILLKTVSVVLRGKGAG